MGFKLNNLAFYLICFCFLSLNAFSQVTYNLNGASGNKDNGNLNVSYACSGVTSGTRVILIAEQYDTSPETIKFYLAKNTNTCTSGGNSNFSGGTWELFINGTKHGFTETVGSTSSTSGAKYMTFYHTTGVKNITASFKSSQSGQTWNMPAISVTAIQTCNSTPSNGSTSNITSNSFRANWNSVSGATQYEINYAKNYNNYSNSEIFTSSAYTNITNLDPNTTYKFQVRAKCSNGVWGPWSPTLATATTSSPPQPGITLTDPASGSWGFGETKTISWSTTNGGCGPYNVEISTDNGSSWIVIGSHVTGNSMSWSVGKDHLNYPIANMLNNNLRLKVYCVSNTSVSDLSNSFTLANPSISVTTPPSLTTGQNHTVSWTINNASCTTYHVELVTNNGTPKVIKGHYMGGSTFTWTVPDDENGNDIVEAIGSSLNRLKVYCTNYNQISGLSSNFSITHPSCNLSLPDANSGSASSIASTGFTAQWPAVSGAAEYQINVAEYSNTTYSTPLTLNSTTNSVVVTGLNPSTQYRFQIRAKCSNGLWTVWSPTLATPTTYGPITLSNITAPTTWHCNKTINWISTSGTGNVTIELGNTNTGFVGIIASNIPNTGSFNWIVGKRILNGNTVDIENFDFSQTYYLKIYPHNTVGQGTTGNGFTIPQPSITVSSPVENSNFLVGQTITMNYATQNLCGPMTVELTNLSEVLLQAMPNGQSIPNVSPYTYMVTNTFPTSGSYKLKIYPTVSSGASPAVGFSPAFTVTATNPNCPTCITGRSVADFLRTAEEGLCAAQYLCDKGIITANQTPASSAPTAILIRQDAAQILVRALLLDAQIAGYNQNPANINFPTQYYHTPFEDLNNSSDPNNYHQAAKVLSYLSYATDENSITPFRKAGVNFYPSNGIARIDFLKLVCEAFNIELNAPTQAVAFTDVSGITGRSLEYLKKSLNLNIITNAQPLFRPYDLITREEAFLILARLRINHPSLIKGKEVLENGANYLLEQNVTYNSVSIMRSMAAGNFAYTENGFSIPDIGFPLSFGFTYSSVITGWPDVYRKIEPMGVGWTHNFNSYIIQTDKSVTPNGVEEGQALLILANGDGTFHTFNNNNNSSPIVRSMDTFNDISVTKSNGIVSQYEVKRPDQVVFKYNQVHSNEDIFRLTEIRDRYGNKMTLSYKNATVAGDIKMLLDKVTAPSGRYITFEYDFTDKLSKVKYPGENGYDRQLRFDYYATWDGPRTERLQRFVNARHADLPTNLKATRYKYGVNAKGIGTTPAKTQVYMLEEIVRPKNNRIKVNYDRSNKVTSIEEGIENSNALVDKTTYDRSGCPAGIKCAKVTGTDNVTFTHYMNEQDITYEISSPTVTIKRPENSANPSNPAWFSVNGLKHGYSYSGKGIMLTDTTYDKNSNVKHIQKWQYDDQNNLEKYWDPNSNGTGDPLVQYNYSADKKYLLSTAQRVNSTTVLTQTFNQKTNGQLNYSVDAEGQRTNFFYNNYGNVDRVEYVPLSLSSTATYDFSGRVKTSTNAKGQTSQVFYDKNDNVIKTISPAPLSYVTEYTFDDNDNLIEIKNAKGKTTYLKYDKYDRDSLITFEGSTQKYFYNNDVNSPNFGKITLISKPWANLSSGASPGRTFQYTYDNDGFLKSNGYITDVTYKKTGGNPPDENTLLSITGGTNSHTLSDFKYDDLVRLNEYKDHYGNVVKYVYDNNGNVTRIQYPNNNYVDYWYDRGGRLTTVKWNTTKEVARYVYTGSRLSYVQYGNGVRTTYTYDHGGRLSGMSTRKNSGNGAVIAAYTYEFDNVGNHYAENITEPYPQPTLDTDTVTYTYNDANRLQTMDNTAFAYDGDGNVNTKGNKTYTYDLEDNLRSVQGGGMSSSFEYDALSNRRKAVRNGTETRYVLDVLGLADVLAETDANDAVQNYYIHGLGLVARVKPNGTLHYYHGDYRGSVIAMTNDAQTLTHQYQYDDFGNVLNLQEADQNLFRYVGLYGIMYEGEDLAYVRARYYDPTTGRFNSTDPIWSTNLYPYANNNGVMNVDLTGEKENPAFTAAKKVFFTMHPELKGLVELHHWFFPQRVLNNKYFPKILHSLVNSQANLVALTPYEHSVVDFHRNAKGFNSLTMAEKVALQKSATSKIIQKVGSLVGPSMKIASKAATPLTIIDLSIDILYGGEVGKECSSQKSSYPSPSTMSVIESKLNAFTTINAFKRGTYVPVCPN